ncbi:MAG: hypothetical protein ACRDXX_12275, partial [Stackebrandtia sp.]
YIAADPYGPPVGDDVVMSETVYPAWSTLRDRAIAVMATTSENLGAAGKGVTIAAHHYAARDTQTAEELRQSEKALDETYMSPPPIPDDERPKDDEEGE